MRALRGAWSWLRQVTGDAAYENYLRCARRAMSHAALHGVPLGVDCGSASRLSRIEFYLDSLERRYSSASRCC